MGLHMSFSQELNKRNSKRSAERMRVDAACSKLISQNLVCLTPDGKYTLTEAGRAKAEFNAQMMDRGARTLETQFLSPQAAARNTIAAYLVLAVMKLGAGLFGGSVGLVADGADTSMDTASAGVVWLGLRFKKELLGTIAIIALMFGTAATLAWNSFSSIAENVNGTFVPMSSPLLVIAVEMVALMAAFLFSYYQRFVGKRSRSLALISQSIDSKNSVYSAAAVIIGAVFSIFGVYWVDAIAGAYIAFRITWDSFGLTREAYRAFKGKEPDFGQYKMPFEDKIKSNREETFRNWILYCVYKNNPCNKQAIVASLHKTFRPSYLPAIFSEFTVGKDYDFEGRFVELVKPLLVEKYLRELAEGGFELTELGQVHMQVVLANLRYHQFED